MEVWDVYNKDREKTGKTMRRGEEYQEGAYHLVVHACIFNSKGEMLIQQRQSFKQGWPNLWDITARGSAITGESSQEAMEREIYEEIGLKLDLQNIRPHMTTNFKFGFNDIYLIEKDVDINDLTLQYEEVQNAKWATLDEIFEMIDHGTFISYHKSLIHLFFDMRKQCGNFR